MTSCGSVFFIAALLVAVWVNHSSSLTRDTSASKPHSPRNILSRPLFPVPCLTRDTSASKPHSMRNILRRPLFPVPCLTRDTSASKSHSMRNILRRPTFTEGLPWKTLADESLVAANNFLTIKVWLTWRMITDTHVGQWTDVVHGTPAPLINTRSDVRMLSVEVDLKGMVELRTLELGPTPKSPPSLVHQDPIILPIRRRVKVGRGETLI
uniref:Uncharacterized protein n=1 Tax=Timema tahoe TaxID=61484 RepID=A0A7R9FGQ0_9NEOP|nr:unnamed protein product [Timema tahoe]